MKFSIIVPVYNVEKFLRESLDSIISQTLKDFEVICVNDGSTDNSLEILKKYANKDSRIKVISQENQGQGVARNNAIDIAHGKYLLFVDPDDFIESNTLEVLYNKFHETDVDIIQFDYATCKEDGTHKRVETFKKRLKKYFNYSIKNNQIFNWHEIKKKNLEKMFLAIWNKAYKTSFIKEHHIKFAPTKTGEDNVFSISSNLLANKILYINKVFYFYRTRTGSAVTKASNDNFDVFENMKILKDFLVTNNLYEEYKSSFDGYVLSVLSWHFSKIPHESSEKYLEICREILDQENYELFLHKTKGELSILERIFSIKNREINGVKVKSITILGVSFLLTSKRKNEKVREFRPFEIKKTKTHLIYMLLGFKLKIKRPFNKKQYSLFINHVVKSKTILIIEINNCHWETIPGYYKYLIDLGFNVEVITRYDAEGIFKSLNDDTRIKIFEFNEITFDKVLKNYDFTKYERIIYNSKRVYYKNDVCGEGLDLSEYFDVIPEGKKRNIYIQHHIDKINAFYNSNQIILANPSKNPELENNVVNPHYFGNFKLKNYKNIDEVNFISIGELSKRRRNSSLLIDAVKKLYEMRSSKFKITVIGSGELNDIPEEIKPYFDILGRVDYQTMFDELVKSDFILPLLDPEIEAHKRYMENGTSGTFQLIYGFNKPCIIHKVFADIYNFNSSNSLIYEDNSRFFEMMLFAINLKNEEYKKIQECLKIDIENIEMQSIKNLKNILKESI